MNCQQVRQRLALWDLGDLAPREARALEAHLERCPDCREAQQGHSALAECLTEYQAPALPDGFEDELHQRLTEARSPQPSLAREPGAPTRVGRPAALAAGLLAAGIAIGALGLWAVRHRPGAGPESASAPSSQSMPSHRAFRHAPPLGMTPAARHAISVRQGDIAVVTLLVYARTAHPNATLEVVLPDGLSLIGTGRVVYPEKQLRWTTALQPGLNRIRVPVRASRGGTWRLVARAHAGPHQARTSARLVVSPS